MPTDWRIRRKLLSYRGAEMLNALVPCFQKHLVCQSTNDLNPFGISKPNRSARFGFAPQCPVLNTRLRDRTVLFKSRYGSLTTVRCSLFTDYCCNTTWSPSFTPLRISVTEPLESPTLTGTFRWPSFCLLS